MEQRRRKRGIKACRHKLEQLMLKNGFESQSALAKHIAIIEKESKPPYPLVNKIFREERVSVKNMLRIAAAFEVELHKILKDATQLPLTELQNEIDEEKPDIQTADSNTTREPIEEQKPSRANSRLLIYSSIALFAVLIIIGLSTVDFNKSKSQERASVSSKTLKVESLEPVLGKIRIKIITQNVPKATVRELKRQFEQIQSTHTIFSSSADEYSMSSNAMYNKWPVQLVLRVRLVKGLVYDVLQAEWVGRNQNQFIAHIVAHPVWMKNSASNIADTLSQRVSQLIKQGELQISLPEARAVSLVQQARDDLFFASSQSDYENAELLFRQALQISADYAEANAGLCDTLVKSQWFDDDLSTWVDAEEYCSAAQYADPENINTITALSQLYSFTGRLEQSADLLKNLEQQSEHHFDLSLLMASISDKLSKQVFAFPSPHYAHLSIKTEKRNWRAYNLLGHSHFAQGDIENAMQSFGESYAIIPQETVGTNLGVMQICLGQLEDAQRTFLSLIESFDNGYLAYENIATTLFLTGEYEAALDNLLTSISLQPDIRIHQVWSQLSNIYSKLEQKDKAIEHLQKAMQYLQEDILRESSNPTFEVFELSYQLQLASLLDKPVDRDETERKFNELLKFEGEFGVQALQKMARLAKLVGNEEKKNQLLNQVVSVCPVYERMEL